jgi:hypothetical protein
MTRRYGHLILKALHLQNTSNLLIIVLKPCQDKHYMQNIGFYSSYN